MAIASENHPAFHAHINDSRPHYYEEKFRLYYFEWRKFIDGEGTPNSNVISPEILDSWKRSRTYGINPLSVPVPPVLSPEKLQKLKKKNKSFIREASVVLKNLFKHTSGFAVFLFDEEGFILERMFEERFRILIERGQLVEGAQWTERTTGTTSFGLVQRTMRAVQVFGPQHYCLDYHGETSCAAPVFDPDGEYIGGIALLAHHHAIFPHTLGLTSLAAQQIAAELQTLRTHDLEDLSRSFHRAALSTVSEAILTIDTAGKITLINEAAINMLRLQHDAVEGKHITEIVPRENEDFHRLLESTHPVYNAVVSLSSEYMITTLTVSCTAVHSSDGRIVGKKVTLDDRTKALVRENRSDGPSYRIEDIWGQNANFLEMLDQVRHAAQSDSAVLLLGESGTGKDLFARAIHNLSARKSGPFLSIDCSAIARNRIVGELLGPGEASAGEIRPGFKGRLAQCAGGTVYLNRIAETPPDFQSALLRFLKEKTLKNPSGDEVPLDIRIITASNRDLPGLVRSGQFSPSLYYYLNVLPIRVIPLRERHDDIPMLTKRFARKIGQMLNRSVSVNRKVIDLFIQYSWPGNVRELQNAIERMITMMSVEHENETGSDGKVQVQEITVDNVPQEIIDECCGAGNSGESLAEAEKRMIKTLLDLGIPKQRIAQRLKISRSTLYRKIEHYGLI